MSPRLLKIAQSGHTDTRPKIFLPFSLSQTFVYQSPSAEGMQLTDILGQKSLFSSEKRFRTDFIL